MSDASRRDSGTSDASRRDSAEAAAATHGNGASRGRVVAGHALWMFDFDDTLAPLEPAVDWAGSRRDSNCNVEFMAHGRGMDARPQGLSSGRLDSWPR